MIKEVADVTFYHLDDTGTPDYPVLYLDTLKVSTIEQTAETAEARGGKGNPPIIVWDYGKEITVTLEDALFSAKSMAIMFGNGTVKNYNHDTGGGLIMKTETFVSAALAGEPANTLPSEATSAAAAKVVSGWDQGYTSPDGHRYVKVNPKFYDANGQQVVASSPTGTQVQWEAGQTYFCTYDLRVDGAVIEISANSFPGTYYITGDKPHNCLLAA